MYLEPTAAALVAAAAEAFPGREPDPEVWGGLWRMIATEKAAEAVGHWRTVGTLTATRDACAWLAARNIGEDLAAGVVTLADVTAAAAFADADTVARILGPLRGRTVTARRL